MTVDAAWQRHPGLRWIGVRVPILARRPHGRLWLTAHPPADGMPAEIGPRTWSAPLEQALTRLAEGDWVMLPALRPDALVDASERVLGHGAHAILDLTRSPLIVRAFHPADAEALIVLPPASLSFGARALLRIRDLLAASLGLVVLSPVFAVLALLIKRSSPGPVFFATTVVGRDGRPFTWWKFRSMHVGRPEDDERRREQYRDFLTSQGHPRVEQPVDRKIVDQSRVTGIGRFIRRHSIDELPQLWNVLRGEMTLVGPRPCLPYEYELQAPWQRLRYRVTPGLTGPWQVYGRSRVSFDEMVLMDYCYGYRRSFWLDLRLILQTVRVVFTGEGGK